MADQGAASVARQSEWSHAWFHGLGADCERVEIEEQEPGELAKK